MADEALSLCDVRRRIAANNCDLSGSVFTDVCMAGVAINDANLTALRIDNANMSGSAFTDVNMTGVAINDANLTGLKIDNANLCQAALTDCKIDGMTIFGVPVTDMLAAWRVANPGKV